LGSHTCCITRTKVGAELSGPWPLREIHGARTRWAAPGRRKVHPSLVPGHGILVSCNRSMRPLGVTRES
jgi:hypothetical protein